MLQKIFPEESPNISSESKFIQDGTPTHASKMAMEWLQDRFPEKLISLKSEFIWHPTFTRSDSVHQILKFLI